MIYREFSKKIDFKPSALGFGLMRLPLKDDKTVDIEESVKIARYAIDNGVNYLDTAYMYHGGQSEIALCEILKDGYRDKVKIADKMPMWQLKEDGDLDKIFFEQLEKLKVEKIDFYLLHALHRKSLETINKFKVVDWFEKKKNEGLIGHIGFSFHDTFPIWKKIIDHYDWDFCMLQFNLVDIKQQLRKSALDYARKKDIGIIVMEPLRGGQLSLSIPDEIMDLWSKVAISYGIVGKFNPVQFLLDWIWNYKEIGFLISGMSNFQQVKENVEFAKSATVNKLTTKQLKLFNEIQKAYLQRIVINCTKCDYCKDCPQKIAISDIFSKLNEIKRYENQSSPAFGYNFIAEDRRANKCTDCKVCVPLCPQKLDIPNLLKKCSMVFDEKKMFNEVFV
ncbi:MAG: aldo/keto reductase [Candidatus Cloacimonetes bacterium]|nr:aldo/keto reductase [Candidatus Cloacimonadota bacterium]